MAREENFLLGRGELLVQRVVINSGGGTKKPPYDFEDARERATTKLGKVREAFDALPPAACPGDQAVAVLTVHPRYLSKTDHPGELLDAVGLRAVGSRPKRIIPDEWGIKKPPEGGAITEQLFVAGTRKAFDQWADAVGDWEPEDRGARFLQQIEDVAPFDAASKVRGVSATKDDVVLEVVLHNDHGSQVVRSFVGYAESLGGTVLVDRRRDVEVSLPRFRGHQQPAYMREGVRDGEAQETFVHPRVQS